MKIPSLLFAALLFFPAALLAKNTVQVEIVAVHSATHNDTSGRATFEKAFNGAHSIDRQTEVFNLDGVIEGQHVVLACEDSKGCESPAIGTYKADIRGSKFVHMTFPVPLSEKPVTRWYRIAGTW